MSKPTFVYVTYIATTIEQLWEAITSESFTQNYWGDQLLQSDWQVGSPVEQLDPEHGTQTIGEVLQSEPPHQLAYTFQFLDHTQPSRVRFLLEPSEYQVKLTVIHDQLSAQSYLSHHHRWTMCLSDLKRLLEFEPMLVWVA
ncbi:MAG: SRPBCC domain-containing protein [Tildeniella nuda ZEHNDER 1965/U140]|jgi:uncharacterized protein YndB with AHSA1/START domain|nr:SRPBCC domain-containing protein [Tildeniella nuda ZEHNDER 1965/U140]